MISGFISKKDRMDIESSKIHISLAHDRDNVATAFGVIMPILQKHNLVGMKFINNTGLGISDEHSNIQGKEVVIYLTSEAQVERCISHVLPELDAALYAAGVVPNKPPRASYPFSKRGYVFMRSAFCLTGTYLSSTFFELNQFTLNDLVENPILKYLSISKSVRADSTFEADIPFSLQSRDKERKFKNAMLDDTIKLAYAFLSGRTTARMYSSKTKQRRVIKALLQRRLLDDESFKESQGFLNLLSAAEVVLQTMIGNGVIVLPELERISVVPALYKLLVNFTNDFIKSHISHGSYRRSSIILKAFDTYIDTHFNEYLEDLVLNRLRDLGVKQILNTSAAFVFHSDVYSLEQIKTLISQIHVAQANEDVDSMRVVVDDATASCDMRHVTHIGDVFGVPTTTEPTIAQKSPSLAELMMQSQASGAKLFSDSFPRLPRQLRAIDETESLAMSMDERIIKPAYTSTKKKFASSSNFFNPLRVQRKMSPAGGGLDASRTRPVSQPRFTTAGMPSLLRVTPKP